MINDQSLRLAADFSFRLRANASKFLRSPVHGIFHAKIKMYDQLFDAGNLSMK